MSPWRIFITMLEAGMAAVGGGSGTLAVAQRVWVPQYISPGLFAFAFGLGQVTPGPLSVSVVALGYQLAGFPGALAAMLGITLPTWLVASAAARGMNRFASFIRPYMKGAPWMVVGLVAATAVGLVRPMHLQPVEWLAMGAATVAVWRRLDPVWILAAALVFGVLWEVLV